MSGLKPISLSDLIIRPMVSEDLAAVLVIERNAHISPWSRLSFEESLTRSEEPSTVQEPLANKKPSPANTNSTTEKHVALPDQTAPYYCRVLQHHETILAYYVVARVADELHILNVVVSTAVQRSGLGHVLMQDIERLSQDLGLSKLFLEVRASNQIAQGLYGKWQFKQIAVRKQYYSSGAVDDTLNTKQTDVAVKRRREDALVYMRLL